MASSQTPFPPPEVLPRSVLVRNISPLATKAAIEDFFSFVCPIETLRLRTVRSPNSNDSTQEAVVVFTESRARADAIVMDKSTIVDQPVTISAVPENYDFNALPTTSTQQGGLLGGFAGFGTLFAGVGSAVAAEVEKAGKFIDDATETGVLKTAKEQVAAAGQRTREIATDLDGKWQVSSNVRTFAESSKANAALVASTVASQTKNVAQKVDENLHLSEQTEKLAEQARQNTTLNRGLSAITGGFNSIFSQTGLAQPNSSPEVAGNGPVSATAPQPPVGNTPTPTNSTQ
ncbi:hypothetical protein BWQ96_02242 [Gracilariopsis chorda]|uniref:RRM domain-containing protein n=1 Tax=Gracilariopsis chorda TaxID=448386 RepID=A0A2V3J0B7_9FLOR|nr:hypothetical protein BWQ96_02242 [Gracilariopsis chorda]|eukprot:PXF47856.1 hypothetical protein BWQ96_02242 [Gracilariopsis chorda]